MRTSAARREGLLKEFESTGLSGTKFAGLAGNRRHTRLKILCWDGTGLWLLTKRLEEGTFSRPKHLEPGVTKLRLSPQALAMLTDGVDLRGGKMRPWYERDAA